ncbi:MAG: BlaI/MecI/CopY family transcriptional regulator [Planctomycetota bacterium]
MANKDSGHLSAAQKEIMEIVWEQGEVSARQVRDLLAARNRLIAKNTVRTLLDRMEEKGWLKHRQDGRVYLYSPAQPKSKTAGKRIVEVLDQLCGGSPEALVSALLDYRGLSQQELNRVRDMLDKAKNDSDLKQQE